MNRKSLFSIVGAIALLLGMGMNVRHSLNDYGLATNKLAKYVTAQDSYEDYDGGSNSSCRTYSSRCGARKIVDRSGIYVDSTTCYSCSGSGSGRCRVGAVTSRYNIVGICLYSIECTKSSSCR